MSKRPASPKDNGNAETEVERTDALSPSLSETIASPKRGKKLQKSSYANSSYSSNGDKSVDYKCELSAKIKDKTTKENVKSAWKEGRSLENGQSLIYIFIILLQSN